MKSKKCAKCGRTYYISDALQKAGIKGADFCPCYMFSEETMKKMAECIPPYESLVRKLKK